MNPERLTDNERASIMAVLSPIHSAAIYLFGSKGTDRQHPGSDIDLAVLPSGSLDPVQCFELANRISSELGVQVDLVNLATATTVMCKEVMRTGERIFTNDLESAREFEMRTLSAYARLNEERAAILAR